MKSRVVVVSHACVLAANQSVYVELEQFFDVTLVVPHRWRDELRTGAYEPQRAEHFSGEFLPITTLGIGRPQRHVSVARATRLLRRSGAHFVIIEEEPFSLAGALWARAARRAGIAYAVQIAENRPRSLPIVIRQSARRVLAGASFVLARSPAALERAREWGYEGPDTVVAHGVDGVVSEIADRPVRVVGFVGRLVAAKGVDDLASALKDHPGLRLRVAGDGPARSAFAALGERVELLGTLSPESMDAFYESISVLAVPSRTTRTWSEQFGRVIVESQARATPVVAYDSGEIGWVASLSAVILVREGDVDALGRALESIALDPVSAGEMGRFGRDRVAREFTNKVLAERLSSFIGSTDQGPRPA